MINLSFTGDKDFPFHGIYRYMSFFIIPIIITYLVLEKPLDIEINFFYKSLLIYIAIMMILMSILARLKSFKPYFKIAHYVFLSGVMAINMFWYWKSPNDYSSDLLIVAFSLTGLAMINNWATIILYTLSTIFYVGISVYAGNFETQLLFLLVSTGVVISLFNNWRNKLITELNLAGQSYKGIFDDAQQQIYVLSDQLEILDYSNRAETYLNEKGVSDFTGKVFLEVFIAETEQCKKNFNEAIESSLQGNPATFNANCSIFRNNDYLPKEFTIRRGKYFGKNVFILNVRIVKDQKDYEKELIAHKDNVTQILENINYFVFNISFDKSDRFKHHVNFVSSNINDVYGYTVDEYISLVKSERVDKDRHPEDQAKINEKFEKLIKKGGKDKWRFRMKVHDKWRWIEEKIFVEPMADKNMVSLFGMVKDVTDEIEAEDLIRESEKRYRQIFETNLAGVYKTSVGGKLLDCNQAFADIVGYTIEELKAGKIQQIYFNNEERENYINDLKEKKQLNNYQVRLKRKDGRRLIVTNNVSIQANEEGEEDVIIGTLIDLTELHETSQALQYSEEKYRLLFEESYDAIVLVVISDEGNFIVDTNQTATKLFRIEENSLIGTDLVQFLSDPNEFKQDIKAAKKALETNSRAEFEWEFVKHDKTSFYAEVSFTSVVMDEEQVAQIVIKDISERKQYEKEILESRLSFKNIVDKSPASILIFSKSGDLEYVNPNGEDLFINVLKTKDHNLYKVFPKEKHALINDLIKEAENDINSYTEIELGEGENAKNYSINIIDTVYNFTEANLFIISDITLQTEYNIQKLRAEMAEEANVSLQEEIERHKRTQRSLIQSTSRLEALFESTGHLYMLTVDKDYNIVAQNQNFKDMVRTYLEKETEIGMNFMDIFPIENYAYDKIIARFQKVFKGEASDLVSNFKSVKGEVVWMESFINPIIVDQNEIEEISFIAHNITEQVENRRRVLLSEENNQALLMAIPDILFKANREGVFIDYRALSEENRKAFSMFTKTDNIKGEKVVDVIKDKAVAQDILRNIRLALDEYKVFTHNFSFKNKEDPSLEIHYENRYTKVNDEEVVIISRDVTSTVEYEQRLLESVKEKEVLLKEVHHRVKNNLQVINSILNLQSSYIEDEKTLQIIIESQNRIRSMSYIHESLYQTKDFSSINFQDYITNLIQNLVQSYEIHSDKTELDLKVDPVELALDQAIPCGLILNELITNALKYAYPSTEGGKITIQVFEKNKKVHIKVQDFGVGLPKGFSISDTDSLGLSLVDTLIDQLDGKLQLNTKGGTEFLIIFDKQEI